MLGCQGQVLTDNRGIDGEAEAKAGRQYSRRAHQNPVPPLPYGPNGENDPDERNRVRFREGKGSRCSGKHPLFTPGEVEKPAEPRQHDGGDLAHAKGKDACRKAQRRQSHQPGPEFPATEVTPEPVHGSRQREDVR